MKILGKFSTLLRSKNEFFHYKMLEYSIFVSQMLVEYHQMTYIVKQCKNQPKSEGPQSELYDGEISSRRQKKHKKVIPLQLSLLYELPKGIKRVVDGVQNSLGSCWTWFRGINNHECKCRCSTCFACQADFFLHDKEVCSMTFPVLLGSRGFFPSSIKSFFFPSLSLQFSTIA